MRTAPRCLAAAMLASLAACGPAPRTPARPDVLVIVIDTVRADRLSAYGAGRPTTPSLDALAREGVLFEDVNVSAARTWSSFLSILTGLYPFHHGVRFIYDQALAPSIPTLASLLATRGYETASFDPIPYVRDMTGGRGFKYHVDADLYHRWVRDDELLTRMSAWLKVRGPLPKFAFVRLQGPHWPYHTGTEYLDAFGEREFEGLDHGFLRLGGSDGLTFLGPGRGFEVTDREAYRRLMFEVDRQPKAIAHRMLHYDAALRATDDLLGAMIRDLRAAGRLDDLLLVVTSDHGESFGEHGYLQHGPRVDDTVMRVPLIVRFPADARHGSSGQRVGQLVRSVDILPTILDTLGLPPPPGIDGVSLLPVIDRGENLNLTCYAESDREYAGVDPEVALPGVAGKQRMLRTRRFKLVYRHDGQRAIYRLYDLEHDPHEREDVAARHPRELAALRAALDRMIAEDPGRDRGYAPLTPEQTEQLRALGYVN